MQLFYILLLLISALSKATELPPVLEPLPKQEFLIQPPDAPSSNMETFGRQLLLHNTNRAIAILKRNDPALGRKVAKIEDMAKVEPPPIEADNFKLTTGLQLDKGIAFSEVTFYSPKLRSEMNVLHKHTTFKLTEGPVSTTYVRQFDSSYNLLLVLSAVFE